MVDGGNRRQRTIRALQSTRFSTPRSRAHFGRAGDMNLLRLAMHVCGTAATSILKLRHNHCAQARFTTPRRLPAPSPASSSRAHLLQANNTRLLHLALQFGRTPALSIPRHQHEISTRRKKRSPTISSSFDCSRN